ncbi:hypothetical protein MTO96_033392 [Rhipicephalus appendiculatus]
MRVFRSSRRARGQRPTHIQEVVPEQDASDVISLLTVHEDKRKGVYIDVVVTPVASSSEPRVAKFLVDTGSAVSIIREQEFRNMFEGGPVDQLCPYIVGLPTPEDPRTGPV